MSHIAVLGVLRGVAGGITEEATDRGFPPPSFSGFGFIGVAYDLSIVAGWQIGSRSPMSASGHKRSFTAILPECPLAGVKRSFVDPILKDSN